MLISKRVRNETEGRAYRHRNHEGARADAGSFAAAPASDPVTPAGRRSASASAAEPVVESVERHASTAECSPSAASPAAATLEPNGFETAPAAGTRIGNDGHAAASAAAIAIERKHRHAQNAATECSPVRRAPGSPARAATEHSPRDAELAACDHESADASVTSAESKRHFAHRDSAADDRLVPAAAG